MGVSAVETPTRPLFISQQTPPSTASYLPHCPATLSRMNSLYTEDTIHMTSSWCEARGEVKDSAYRETRLRRSDTDNTGRDQSTILLVFD